jgi:hypothetical protein
MGADPPALEALQATLFSPPLQLLLFLYNSKFLLRLSVKRKTLELLNSGPNLGRAVTEAVEEDVQHEAPPDIKLDKIQFLINNVSMNNVEQKAQELKDMLEPRYFDWLGHYLVVKELVPNQTFTHCT